MFIKIDLPEDCERIEYEYNEKKREHILSDKEKEAGIYKLYPFESSTLKLILTIIFYFSFSLFITVLFIIIHIVLSEGKLTIRLWKKEYSRPFVYFILIWIILYLIGLFQYVYHFELTYYLPDHAIGDQKDYWETYIFKNGFFNFDVKMTYTFRGYTNYLLSSISKVIGRTIGADPVKVYLVFPSLTISWLITIIIPKLYEFFNHKSPRALSVVLFGAIFVYYWKACITSLTTDIYNNVLFFATIVYAVDYYRKQSIISAIVSGISLGIMTNMHFNFLVSMIVLVTGYSLVMLIKQGKEGKGKTLKNYLSSIAHVCTKKRIIGLFAAAICFFIICIPQAIYNSRAGHKGLIPYDTPDSYGGHAVMWEAWNVSLRDGLIQYPRYINDDQMLSIKTQLYEKNELLNPVQAMDVYANSPIETALVICKKILTVFDYKTNIGYETEIPWRETKGLIFSFFNYIILLSGLFVLLKEKGINSKERIFAWITFVSFIVLRLSGHMEWRISMGFYVILCLLFSYHFIGEIISVKEKYKALCEAGLYKFIAFGILLCMGISMTLWA